MSVLMSCSGNLVINRSVCVIFNDKLREVCEDLYQVKLAAFSLTYLTCPVSVDQPEKVNLTAEEEVDDDDDIPDFRTFKVSAEDAHLFVDHANGTAHHSLIDFVVLDSV